MARFALWPAVALVAYLLLYGFALAHPASRGHMPPACTLRAVTGVPCPTCGGTRATLALASGDAALAFRYNPLVTAAWFLLPAAALAAVIRSKRSQRRGHPVPAWRVGAGLGLLIVALLANWCYILGSLREMEGERGAGPAQTAVAEGPVQKLPQHAPDSSQIPGWTME